MEQVEYRQDTDVDLRQGLNPERTVAELTQLDGVDGELPDYVPDPLHDGLTTFSGLPPLAADWLSGECKRITEKYSL